MPWVSPIDFLSWRRNIKSNADEFLKLLYSTVVVSDVTTDGEPCYVAYNPELEGCMSHGDTPEEALHNLGEVRRLYISTLIAEGLEVPHPQETRANWEILTAGGQEPESVYSLPGITPPIFEPVP